MTPELVLPPALAALVAHGYVTVLGDQPAFTVPCEEPHELVHVPLYDMIMKCRRCGAEIGYADRPDEQPQCRRAYSGPVTLRAGTELPTDEWQQSDDGCDELELFEGVVIFRASQPCSTCGGRGRFDGSVAGDHLLLIMHGERCPDCIEPHLYVNGGERIALRPGEVVGTADIEQVPIVDASSNTCPAETVASIEGDELFLVDRNVFGRDADISDQLAYSKFTPGGTATVFTNARPT